MEKSPFSVGGIEKLKKAGRVTIVYDASFPKRALSTVTAAGFFPYFFKAKGKRKEFLVVVGRFGVKWPTNKLAAVIVHELAGHGIQHLRGRMEADRKIDRECEALIYERAAHQDLGIDGSTRDMVKLRRAMQKNWCSDFRRYMQDRDPALMQLWGHGKPDVPALLKVFEAYIDLLRKTGTSGRAVAATKAHKAAKFARLKAKAKKRRRPKEMFMVGKRYLRGIGVKKNLDMARSWFLKAAKKNYWPAQHMLGAMSEKGVASLHDPIEAYKWYYLAAAQGGKPSIKKRAKLEGELSPKHISLGKARAARWAATGKR